MFPGSVVIVESCLTWGRRLKYPDFGLSGHHSPVDWYTVYNVTRTGVPRVEPLLLIIVSSFQSLLEPGLLEIEIVVLHRTCKTELESCLPHDPLFRKYIIGR